jgi:hypothetical protein
MGGTSTSTNIFSRFEWVNNKRYRSFMLSASPSSQTVGQCGNKANARRSPARNIAGRVNLSASGPL